MSQDFPIPGPFPLAVTPEKISSHPTQPVGQELFDEVTDFYSWYITSWYDGAASEHGEATRKALSLIKRVSEVSMNGGNFLTEREESGALAALRNIFQDLHSGKLRKNHLPSALVHLMETLTRNNPKAKLVALTTELEYIHCINPPLSQSSEITVKYQQIFDSIIQSITPHMREINASALSRELSRFLENSTTTESLQLAIKDWI